MGSPERTVGHILQISKIQDGGGRHLQKTKNRHISATDGPIWTKFGTLMQNESAKRADYSKFAFLKNQDGGGRHLENPLNCDISATVWSISIKFGTPTPVGTPEYDKS